MKEWTIVIVIALILSAVKFANAQSFLGYDLNKKADSTKVFEPYSDYCTLVYNSGTDEYDVVYNDNPYLVQYRCIDTTETLTTIGPTKIITDYNYEDSSISTIKFIYAGTKEDFLNITEAINIKYELKLKKEDKHDFAMMIDIPSLGPTTLQFSDYAKEITIEIYSKNNSKTPKIYDITPKVNKNKVKDLLDLL
jgi:hypothetical protein